MKFYGLETNGRHGVQTQFYQLTSWKKLLSGYRLLRAILSDVGATASLRVSEDARVRAVKILYSAQTTQGSPTWTCSDVDLLKNSSRNRLKCHKD